MISRAPVFLDSLLSVHIIRCHMCPWGRLLPGYNTQFFLQRGCCCQGKEVVPIDHIRGKGLSSRSKIRLTAGFEPCLQGPGWAASHSSKDPPSLAYWLFASSQLNSVHWCCRGRAERENLLLPSVSWPRLIIRQLRKFGPNFRSCLMIDLGRETDGNNEICLGCPFLPCAYESL